MTNDYKLKLRFSKWYSAIFMAFLVFGPYRGFAENQAVIFQAKITGKVSTSDGLSLPGATVTIKGSKQSAVTDYSGSYSITVNDSKAVLVFSFIGFKTQEIMVGNKSVINVILENDSQKLDDIVVVAYGTQKKKNLTGAVSSVKLSDIRDVPASNTASLLQGRMSGVTVSSFSAQPGSNDPQIRIRGIGSFNAGQEPLIIVDGVQSQLNQVPVNDIESISVLKDAASAAIYGVRAANGVIVINTKRGKTGKPTVTLRSNIALSTPTFGPDYLASYDWAKIKNEWAVAEGGNPVYTDAQIQIMKDGSDPDHFANTDWWDQATQTGVLMTSSAQLTGGSENTRYMISGEYQDQTGIVINTSSLRKAIRSNLDIDVSKKFKVGLNVYAFKKTIDQPALYSASNTWDFDRSLLYQVRRGTIPTIPVKYSNGEYGTVDGVHPNPNFIAVNPVWGANTGLNETKQYYTEGKLFASYEFIPGLKWTSSMAQIHSEDTNTYFIPTYERYDSTGAVVALNINNSLSNSNSVWERYVFENLLNYDKTFGNHQFNFLLGQTMQKERNDYMYAYIQNFPNNAITELDAGTANPQVQGNANEVGLLSYFGRMNYVFNDKYLFEANLRYDGSSRMPSSERYGLFPSFSGGWVISNENFLKDKSALSLLKLRGSWGQLGNQEIGNYTYQQTFSTGHDYILGGNIAGGLAISNLANSGITWETTTITDFGIDANFFGNKLQFTADYFNKTSSDVLLRLPIPGSLGVNNGPYQNAAEVSNIGWELSAKYQGTAGDFTYFASANFSQIKNNIEDIAGLENWISNGSINVVGQPIGAYYGFVSEGLYKEDELAKAPTQFGAPLRAGDIKYKDISGPNGTPDGVVSAEYDRTIIGNPFPKFTYGFNLGGGYKGFDINAFFQGVSGIERYNWFNTENIGNFTSSILDHWTTDNTDASYPRFGNGGNNYVLSSYWLKDASYLRMKNLEIGYSFPASVLSKMGLASLRIYTVGTNLVTWTSVKEFDPERDPGDQRNASYPNAKGYSFGVNVSF